jgi:hypothetical protein
MFRDLSIEYDRMMALVPRKTIYLFDVCLLATLFGRVAFALCLAKSGGGTPKNHSPIARDTRAQIMCENPRPKTWLVAQDRV